MRCCSSTLNGRGGGRWDPNTELIYVQVIRYATHGLLRITLKEKEQGKHALGVWEARALSLLFSFLPRYGCGEWVGDKRVRKHASITSGSCFFVVVCIRNLKIHVLHFSKAVCVAAIYGMRKTRLERERERDNEHLLKRATHHTTPAPSHFGRISNVRIFSSDLHVYCMYIMIHTDRLWKIRYI